jgi:hypothetical protein
MMYDVSVLKTVEECRRVIDRARAQNKPEFAEAALRET